MTARRAVAPVVFWSAAGSLAFTYGVFPAVLAVRALVRSRPHLTGDVAATVSIVVAARDEAAVIGDKVANLLAVDWPADLLQVVVVSDGSTDGTAEAARRAGGTRVTVIEQEWLGKAAALEAGVAASTGEILVFTDANSMLATDALQKLTRHFADPDVGGVAGNQAYLPDPHAGGSQAGEARYWGLDRWLKVMQSRAGDAVSATGALYAIRRELFDGVAVGVTDDFYVSTGVITRGRRLVFDPDAIASEPLAPSAGHEFGRKVRVMTRGLRSVMARRELLDPRRYGFYAFQLLVHKVLRRLMAVPLLALIGCGPWLWRRGGAFRLLAAGQTAFYAAALVGTVRPARRGPLRLVTGLPAYFCMVNVAALRAVFNVVTGRRIDRWQPDRATPAAE